MKCLFRWLTGLTIVAVNLAAVIQVVMLTAPGVAGADWSARVDDLKQQRWPAFGAAILFFLCWLVFFWTGRRGRQREQFLTFDGDQGPVSISTLAIADFLTRLAAEFPSIVRIEPIVIPRRHLIDVLLNVRVKAGTQVSELCHLLQQRVRQSLVEEMGVPEVDSIKVNIDGIAGEHRMV